MLRGPSVTSNVPVCFSELKRRMKADKKAAEKDAKVKDQQQNKVTNDHPEQHVDSTDEENLDPNVSCTVKD